MVPTAHYFMGGVVVDPDTRTEMEGLYVAGEDAGGAHGSNRLGGNGVANSTVYGGVAGDVMGMDIRKMGALRDPDENVLAAEIERAIRASVQYAFDHPEASRDYVRTHAQEMSDDVCAQHIALYVNAHSLDIGDDGMRAIARLVSDAR